MIHSQTNEAIESTMTGEVASMAIDMNKVLSHKAPHLFAIPRAMADWLPTTNTYKTPYLWADILMLQVDKHGEIARHLNHNPMLHSLWTIHEDKATNHSEYSKLTATEHNTSYYIQKNEDGSLNWWGKRNLIPVDCAEPEYEENPLDDWKAFMKKTQPSMQKLKTKKKNFISNVQSIFKHMEAGVAEDITNLLATDRSLPMFAGLDPDKEYICLDTQRILNRWWMKGDMKANVVGNHGKVETRGEGRERMLQDDYGVDKIIMSMDRFLDRKNIPTLQELLGPGFIRLQLKGAPQSHKYKSVFCEVQTHLASEDKIVPSGLDKTKAEWTGYALTSKLIVWLPTSEYKRLAYATNKNPSPASKVRNDYDKTSLGMPVECCAIFEHPSLCTTVFPTRYASAFDQISYHPVKEYLPKSQASVAWKSLKNGDFAHGKDYFVLAQDWTLDEYKLFIKGRLPGSRITGIKEAMV